MQQLKDKFIVLSFLSIISISCAYSQIHLLSDTIHFQFNFKNKLIKEDSYTVTLFFFDSITNKYFSVNKVTRTGQDILYVPSQLANNTFYFVIKYKKEDIQFGPIDFKQFCQNMMLIFSIPNKKKIKQLKSQSSSNDFNYRLIEFLPLEYGDGTYLFEYNSK